MHTQKVEKLSFRRLDWNFGEQAQFGVDKMRQLCTYSKCVHAECSACLRKRLGLFLITFFVGKVGRPVSLPPLQIRGERGSGDRTEAASAEPEEGRRPRQKLSGGGGGGGGGGGRGKRPH